ncbi:MAG: site-specific DNA-methyltransferase [Leptospiraceae bacterium]|nr:site-specific DNA-methyltransferase [Leptospiraceae bacterium]
MDAYDHRSTKTPSRPEIGAQGSFKKKKPPKKYAYDPSLDPQLQWAGKAEHTSFDVPTLPLFIHERLSTEAIIETLTGHRKAGLEDNYDLFADPERNIAEQALKAYEHRDDWVNRMILGDSLVVMNSLLEYENMAGKVQMIYMDPPYGVNYSSNFQPFVRNRTVRSEDDDLSREPEMVKAYRDTWELGVHSYLTYMRDRLLLARELLTESGSVFVQISDDNLHHVRQLLDEVFGAENFSAVVPFKTSVPLSSAGMASVCDYLLWYNKDRSCAKYRDLFVPRETGEKSRYAGVELPDGKRRPLSAEERANPDLLPAGSRVWADMDLASSGYTPSCIFDFEFNGRTYRTSSGKSWKTTREGMARLAEAGRISDSGKTVRYVIYMDDYPVTKLANMWVDTTGDTDKYYVVQTHTKVVQRCMLMSTDPGDLVLDPTCGSGTTAYVAEQWGRRWLTIDVSRVPLALARQRLITSTFPYYQLKDPTSGPAGGFVYKRKQNNKGEEVGGIVPHLTLKSIANDEPPAEEILVDRPEEEKKITRVSGPFVVEATIPTPYSDESEDAVAQVRLQGDHIERMLEVLRLSPEIRLPGGKISIKSPRAVGRSLYLHGEGLVEDDPVALVFGPENGAVTERMAGDAWTEAGRGQYKRLFLFGFAIEPRARKLIESTAKSGLPAFYINTTPDLLMGDLLKNMRSSQLFSVHGLPEIKLNRANKSKKDEKWEVTLLGLDVFDPATMETHHLAGDDVPAWFLDIDYNGSVFHVSQAFFPRTGAWGKIGKALKTHYDESVWDHLSGNTSAPFTPGDHRTIAVKVIDDRGNELMIEAGEKELA